MSALWRGLCIGALVFAASFGTAHAAVDPFTEQTLDSYRQTLAAQHSNATPPSFSDQAQYLMLIKNGLSLYRDGAMSAADKASLVKLVGQQAEASSAAIADSKVTGERRQLAKDMHGAALAAQELLKLEPSAPALKGLMDNYHNGLGYTAYRRAQDLGIEQIWIDAI